MRLDRVKRPAVQRPSPDRAAWEATIVGFGERDRALRWLRGACDAMEDAGLDVASLRVVRLTDEAPIQRVVRRPSA